MIKGIGIDLIQLDRIKQSLEKGDRLVNRILTCNEKEVFSAFQSNKRKIEYLAGRFAAKEACAKAIGSGIGKLSFQDIEVLTDECGAPYLTIEGHTSYRYFVSITHTEDYAAAQVVIEEI